MCSRVRRIQKPQQSLELLYNISRELTAALELRTVLERVLFLSMENLGAIRGSILVLDENGRLIDSAFQFRGEPSEETTPQLQLTYDRGASGWVARNRQAVLIPDTSKDDRWFHRPDDESEQTGPKSAICAPIFARDSLVGVMVLVHPDAGFFGDEHLNLLKAIADQAGAAILNARLYHESQRRAQIMTALAESARAITGSLQQDNVLRTILEQTLQALHIEAVSLALVDSQGKELEFRASRGGQQQEIIGKHLALGKGIAGRVAQTGEALLVPDAYQDPRFDPAFDQALGFHTRAILCVPIVAQGRVIGVLEALNPVGDVFDADALQVLSGIGSLAGTAIQNAQLYESQQTAHGRYRELFEDNIDAILITDLKGVILEVNRQMEVTMGVSTSFLKGKYVSDLGVVDQEKFAVGIDRLVAGELLSYEATLQAAEGRNLTVQVYARRVWIGDAPSIQWILDDISEKKQLDSLRQDLISMIYHDLRSPLANVVSSLEVLDSSLSTKDDEMDSRLVGIAMRSTDRIQRLTNSLLDINRLEAGQPILTKTSVAPIELIRDAVEAVSSVALNRTIKISIEIPDDLPVIAVDADMIRRVLVNLLENGIKFSSHGGKIQVGARLLENAVQFWVQDFGHGMSDKEKERIFNKFVHFRDVEGVRSLGLGLAFCRLAILGHGGKIWVEAKEGSGSTFNFDLPTT